MKRLVAVLSGLLVLPAFAEVAPEYFYQEMMAQYAAENPDMIYVTEAEMSAPESDQTEQPADTEPDAVATTPVVPTAVSPRNATGRAAASRAVATSTTTSARNVANRNTAANTARSVSARPTTVRTATTPTTSRVSAATPSRAATSRAVRTAASSGATTASGRPSVTARSTTSATGSTPGVTTRRASATRSNASTARASIVQTDTVNTPLYISSSARVGTTTGNVSPRMPAIRAGTTTTTVSETSTSTSSVSMDELAQLTDYCKAQYTACMDNFCNVLDDNQGRCSCSANLDNYAETEAALKQATEDLQDVAQQIQYIGLTADQVETLFTQTEAEMAMQSTNDNTQLNNEIKSIGDALVDVISGRASSSSSSSGGLSLVSGLFEFSFDNTGFDLTSFLGMNTVDTSSISNQRGEDLYDTATERCRASVLNACQAQGVDISIITNSYDLEIDKACIAYERALTDSNDQMSAMVRNARSVLQRARLMVAQQKNMYDLRECVTELDRCMQDDFVCGDNYENCLDPSGQYIVNGEVVVGSKPGAPGNGASPIYDMWNYKGEDNDEGGTNAWYGENGEAAGNLAEYIAKTVTATPVTESSNDISKFLQAKIGYHSDADNKNYGMCMSVLNQCQDLTYNTTGQTNTYKPDNNVVKEFLNRTLVQIKSAQDTVLADYAEDCITDVASCLSQNNYDADEAGYIRLKRPLYAKVNGSDCEQVDATYVVEHANTLTSDIYTDDKCSTKVTSNTLDSVLELSGGSAANSVARRACNPIITTCMSVNGVEDTASGGDTLTTDVWLQHIMGN